MTPSSLQTDTATEGSRGGVRSRPHEEHHPHMEGDQGSEAAAEVHQHICQTTGREVSQMPYVSNFYEVYQLHESNFSLIKLM